ncbi:3'-5' exonuclease eri1 [Neolecta irregularis DAH-3]|uniref:3'-5' exonuclease eri1 n=1 Tax=Neolecta irregularis (strain DAH-3) TaxID=1198029 RepID=A0A1U7LQP9_NEOID|nr:3'-5' exonuclease eri1 [Neolecta irregularis DAH-3]|eukprot:OLL24985.1 3'-5' exonuclease eri1 [Neolecta irregularis DAH-3]
MTLYHMDLSASVQGLREQLEMLNLSTKGHKDVLRRRLREARKKSQKHVHFRTDGLVEVIDDNSPRAIRKHQPNGLDLKQLRYLLFMDFEATCIEGHGRNFKHEIIEFPCLIYDIEQQVIIDEFKTHVRPLENPILSDFCIQLTNIQQSDVDQAPTFCEALELFERFLDKHESLFDPSIFSVPVSQRSRQRKWSGIERNWAFATDGRWDIELFLIQQMGIEKLPYYFCGPYVDVRGLFSDFLREKRCSLVNMLRKWDLKFEGTEHCGRDDAFNLSRIVSRLIQQGCIVEANRWIQPDKTRGWIIPRRYPRYKE